MKGIKRRCMAMLLSVCLLVTVLPASAFAVNVNENASVKVKKVSLGEDHSAAITEDGSLWMWGSNWYGQLGDGTTTDSSTPIKIMDNVKDVVLGEDTSAAIKEDGSLWMWGANSRGQLGDGTTLNSSIPIQIMDGVKDIELSGYTSAVIKEDRSLWMWGANNTGQLGNGTIEDSNVPVKILDNIKKIIVKSNFVSAISEDSNLYTWGKNEYGRLGNGNREDTVYSPTLILSEVKSIAANSSNMSAIKNDNSLWRWGSNFGGQIGDGDSEEARYEKYFPVKVLEDVKYMDSNAGPAAITSDGSLWIWGHYYDGIKNCFDMSPRKKNERCKNVYYEEDEYWMVKEDNTFWRCSIDGYKPTPIQIMDNVDGFCCDSKKKAVVKMDGSLWMWGQNDYGQLGDGTTEDRYTPICIMGGNDDISSITKIPGAINHYYGLNSYKNTPAGDVYDDAIAFVKAMDSYLTELQKATQKDIQAFNKSGKSSAQMLKEADAATNDKIITMDATLPDEAMNSVYETLAQYLDMYVETGVSLGKIDMSASTIEISTSIVNKIRNNLDSLNFTRKIGKYTVTFRILKFMWAYSGSVTVQGNGHTYSGIIVSSSKDTAETLTAYINDMSQWAEDALYQSLKSIFVELSDITGIGDYTKKEINSFLKDKVEVLQNRGYGNLLTFWQAMRDGYDICQDIVTAKDASTLSDVLDNADSIYNKIKKLDYSDEAVANKTVIAAMNKLNNAKNNLEQSLYYYIYEIDNGTGGNRDGWWSNVWDSFKSIFVQCPVDFVVYDSDGKELGKVEDTEVNYTPDIYISVDGDVKTIIIPSGIDVRIEFVGTDSGDMTYIIEQTVEGEITGRLNYYNIPLIDGCTYLQDVTGENLTEDSDFALISDIEKYVPSEYISVDNEDANITVECDIEGNGIVRGIGNYATGSPVVLTAYPEDDSFEFVGWYVNDNLVESKSVYRFSGVNDVTVKAVFKTRKVIDEAFSSIISEEYEELADIFVYKASDSLDDVVISMAGAENIETLSVCLKEYDENNMLVQTEELETHYDGLYRFVIPQLELKDFSKIEVYNVEGELIGIINSVYVGEDDQNIPITALILESMSLEIEPGNVHKLVATTVPDNATDKTLIWESRDVTVATVDKEGVVTAVSEGETTITATAKNGVSVSCKVTVKKASEVNPIPDQKFPFTDVNKSDWFYGSIAYVNANNLMTGLNETTFGPTQSLARAQFAIILHRMNGTPEVTYTDKFPDVPDGVWFTDAILWASSTGVVTGYTDTGKFGPADNINREQMAVMMYRYANYKGYDTGTKADFSKFSDASKVSGFAEEAMQWAVGTGIITGKDNETRLDPQGNASRAECATIIMRFVEKYE